MRITLGWSGLVLLFGTMPGFAQGSSWEYDQQRDALHAAVVHKFVLNGKYLSPPRTRTITNPALVVVCNGGTVQNNYFAVGAVINRRVDGGTVWVNGEARLDGKAELFTFDSVSTDGTAAYFTRKDLKKALLAKQVIIGLDEFLGPQIVMQFNIPDPSVIMQTACGQDHVLKDAFKRRPANSGQAGMPASVSGIPEHPDQMTKSVDWTALTPDLTRKISAQAKEISANVLATTKSPAAAAVTDSSASTKELIKSGQAAICVIFSDPPGAEIYVDGEQLTVTPVAFALRKHDDTPRMITIKKQGYRTVQKAIVPSGQTAALDLVLEAE